MRGVLGWLGDLISPLFGSPSTGSTTHLRVTVSDRLVRNITVSDRPVQVVTLSDSPVISVSLSDGLIGDL